MRDLEDDAPTDPAMLRAELDRLYEPPTAVDPNELPEQSGPRYPLARVERADMSVLALIAFLFRLWVWRVRDRRRK
jgi:hypothetical protein